MPAKKKAKGKAKKKAAKAKKTEEAAAAEQTTTATNPEESLGAQAQKDDDEDALLEEAMKLAAAEKKELDAEKKKAAKRILAEECNHGCDPVPEDSHDCVGFIYTFFDELKAAQDRGESLIDGIPKANQAASKKYPGVWNDSTKVGRILSNFLAKGTKHIIDEGCCDNARACASVAVYFEQYMAILFHTKTQLKNVAKIIEMRHCDEHTLVSYFRNRVPCKCLDKKYKEVKSITKMGMCFNPECTLPNGKAERKGMLHCIRCRQENYCSRECQVARWPAHKEACKDLSIGKLRSKLSRKLLNSYYYYTFLDVPEENYCSK